MQEKANEKFEERFRSDIRNTDSGMPINDYQIVNLLTNC